MKANYGRNDHTKLTRTILAETSASVTIGVALHYLLFGFVSYIVIFFLIVITVLGISRQAAFSPRR